MKQQTANSKQQTANSKQQTANSKQQTANSKQQNSTLLIPLLLVLLSASLHLKAQCTKPNNGITQNGTTLMAIETDATYQWLDCNNSSVTNETNRSFAPTATGNYAVAITKNNCKNTSRCFSFYSPTLSATVTGKTITIPTTAGSFFYTWTNCAGANVAAGTTNTSYTATQSGSYSVEKTPAGTGIQAYSACVTVCFADKPTVTKTGSTLSINKVIGATYRWLDCGSNNAPIMGATDTAYTPTATGQYAVEITRSTTCKDTSVCTAVKGVGLIENTFASDIKLYPNPTSNKVTIELGNNYSNVAVEITNILGQVITSKSIATVTNRKIILPINASSGIYFVKVEAKEGFASFKVVKE